jgi:beta-glucosidase
MRSISSISSSAVAVIATLALLVNGQNDGDTSPPHYPSPWMRGGDGWADAYAKAQKFVSGLTLLEKVNLTTGVGWEGEQCVGMLNML